ncbi:hypothetical protein ACFYVL_35600 [Streptomyces sp. NPDC004111]|uniref:hypothetical protein n=1 Tax=Streptomyces sp. NPDC004111 TaxID=3364690 RepID=UPI003680322F
MTHRPGPVTRVCPDCDGFPVVAITTGTRHRDGSRHVVPAICRTCHGTGTRTLARPLPVPAGR